MSQQTAHLIDAIQHFFKWFRMPIYLLVTSIKKVVKIYHVTFFGGHSVGKIRISYRRLTFISNLTTSNKKNFFNINIYLLHSDILLFVLLFLGAPVLSAQQDCHSLYCYQIYCEINKNWKVCTVYRVPQLNVRKMLMLFTIFQRCHLVKCNKKETAKFQPQPEFFECWKNNIQYKGKATLKNFRVCEDPFNKEDITRYI